MGGKQKNKKKDKDIKDPVKLKELGNKAYINQNYDEAVEFFSKAIELQPDEPVFYSNRATVYFEQERFDDSLNDCDKALELNPKMVKAMYRKAQVLSEQLKVEEAIKILKQSIEVDSENHDVKNLLKLFEEEF